MVRFPGRFVVLSAALSLLALPVQAEIFKVKLLSGETIETRYQPQEASWDPDVVLLLTDVGNWIGVEESEVESVEREALDRGFGFVIDNTTIELGMAPNDLPVPTEETVDARVQALQNLLNEQRTQQPYTIQQFVEPNQTQGIPGSMVGAPNGSERLGTDFNF